MVLLSARIQDNQFNTFTSALIYDNSIIYKSSNKPNQSIFLTMSPSTNTRSGSTASKEKLDIVHPTSPTSTYLSKSNLKNIHNYIKVMTDKHHFDMKYLNDQISDMLVKLTDTSSKIDKNKNNSQIFHPN